MFGQLVRCAQRSAFFVGALIGAFVGNFYVATRVNAQPAVTVVQSGVDPANIDIYPEPLPDPQSILELPDPGEVAAKVAGNLGLPEGTRSVLFLSTSGFPNMPKPWIAAIQSDTNSGVTVPFDGSLTVLHETTPEAIELPSNSNNLEGSIAISHAVVYGQNPEGGGIYFIAMRVKPDLHSTSSLVVLPNLPSDTMTPIAVVDDPVAAVDAAEKYSDVLVRAPNGVSVGDPDGCLAIFPLGNACTDCFNAHELELCRARHDANRAMNDCLVNFVLACAVCVLSGLVAPPFSLPVFAVCFLAANTYLLYCSATKHNEHERRRMRADADLLRCKTINCPPTPVSN